MRPWLVALIGVATILVVRAVAHQGNEPTLEEEEEGGEVEKVILEITQGKKAIASLSGPEASIDLPELPAERVDEEAETVNAQVDEAQDEVEQMRNRLEELKSS